VLQDRLKFGEKRPPIHATVRNRRGTREVADYAFCLLYSFEGEAGIANLGGRMVINMSSTPEFVRSVPPAGRYFLVLYSSVGLLATIGAGSLGPTLANFVLWPLLFRTNPQTWVAVIFIVFIMVFVSELNNPRDKTAGAFLFSIFTEPNAAKEEATNAGISSAIGLAAMLTIFTLLLPRLEDAYLEAQGNAAIAGGFWSSANFFGIVYYLKQHQHSLDFAGYCFGFSLVGISLIIAYLTSQLSRGAALLGLVLSAGFYKGLDRSLDIPLSPGLWVLLIFFTLLSFGCIIGFVVALKDIYVYRLFAKMASLDDQVVAFLAGVTSKIQPAVMAATKCAVASYLFIGLGASSVMISPWFNSVGMLNGIVLQYVLFWPLIAFFAAPVRTAAVFIGLYYLAAYGKELKQTGSAPVQDERYARST
jgi:hypothetical protein